MSLAPATGIVNLRDGEGQFGDGHGVVFRKAVVDVPVTIGDVLRLTGLKALQNGVLDGLDVCHGNLLGTWFGVGFDGMRRLIMP